MNTIDNAILAVQTYIETNIPALTVFRSGDDDNLTPPFVTVEDTGSEEHDVLPNVLRVSIAVTLVTLPGDSDQHATTDAAHRALAAEIMALLMDYEAIKTSCSSIPYFTCFDVRGLSLQNSVADGTRTTAISLVITCE